LHIIHIQIPNEFLIFQNQYISVTDLQTHTKKHLSDLKKNAKFIFSNNKPKTVMLDISVYETLVKNKPESIDTNLIPLPKHEITPEILKSAGKAYNTNEEDFTQNNNQKT